MKRKLLVPALIMGVLLTMFVMPASAAGDLTLKEAYLQKADGTKLYTTADTSATPYMWVDNTSGQDKSVYMIAASYSDANTLADVKLASVTVPDGESKITSDAPVTMQADGTTSIMLWDTDKITPVLAPSVTFSSVSKDAEIKSFSINGCKGYITNEMKDIEKVTSTEFNTTQTYEKNVKVNLLVGDPNTAVDMTALTPVITVADGATISPASGVAVDFSSGSADYTVTAADGTQAVYTVYVDKMVNFYGETVGSTFETFTPDELAVVAKNSSATKANVLASDNPDSGTGSLTGSGGYLSAYKGAYGSAEALYYSRTEVDGGKAQLRDGETLSAFYASTTDTDPVEAGNEADTDIAWVLDSTGNKVLHAGLFVSRDPADTTNGNLCLRFDKRATKAISASTGFTFSEFVYTPNLDRYKRDTLKRTYDFDLYVPNGGINALNDIELGLWNKSGDSTSPAYRLIFSGKNNKLDIVYKSTNGGSTSEGYNIASLINGTDKWVHITVEASYDTSPSYALNNIAFYVDYELSCVAHYISDEPIKGFGGTTARRAWAVRGMHSAAKGVIYIDNIKLNAKVA